MVSADRASWPSLGGRYAMGPPLGRRGASEVRRGHDTVLDRPVAIELLPASDGEGTPPRPRALAQVVHPGLVTVYDAGTWEGRDFVVMQLVEGATLAERLADGPLPPAAAAALGADLLDALAAVHAAGVVHLDVSPATIVLDADGRPLLGDSGTAHVVAVAAARTDGLVGAAAYVAPEQVRDEPVGPPADVYSAGLVVLEALTGRREYPGTGVRAAVAHLTRPPAVPDGLPDGLGDVLAAMTAAEPVARPTAAAAAADLRAVAEDLEAAAADVPDDLSDDGVVDDGAASGPDARRLDGAGGPAGVALAAVAGGRAAAGGDGAAASHAGGGTGGTNNDGADGDAATESLDATDTADTAPVPVTPAPAADGDGRRLQRRARVALLAAGVAAVATVGGLLGLLPGGGGGAPPPAAEVGAPAVQTTSSTGPPPSTSRPEDLPVADEVAVPDGERGADAATAPRPDRGRGASGGTSTSAPVAPTSSGTATSEPAEEAEPAPTSTAATTATAEPAPGTVQPPPTPPPTGGGHDGDGDRPHRPPPIGPPDGPVLPLPAPGDD